METKWSKQEFTSYLFIYCANADYNESKEEIDFVKSKISESGYKRIHEEFEKDNDFQSLQKIQSTIKRLNLTEQDLNIMCEEIKNIFLLDGNYDILEQNMFLGLKRILSQSLK